MSEKSFAVKGSIELGDITLDLTNTALGSSLHRVGNSVTAKNETPIGTVIMYTGIINGSKTNVPTGWLLCDGTETSVSSYPELDSIVGTRYGSRTNGSGGAGTTHFRLPDLTNKLAVGHIQSNTTPPNTVSTPSSSEGYNHSHNRGHNSSDVGDFASHTHGVVAQGHNHGSSDARASTGGHTLSAAGAHTHSLKGGNISANTGNTGTSHNHNLGSSNSAHGHSSTAASTNHAHNPASTASLQHGHNVVLPSSDANQTMNNSSHQHATGFSTTRFNFIIKAEHGV